MRRLPAKLIDRLPFHYGWLVLACVCCAGFSRQGPAVATLSIFVEPMTAEFGWSRTALSGAVSLGGVLAALASPLIGPSLDRKGARIVLCLAVLSTAAATMLLSLTSSLLVFYLLFCFARMNFAGPYDLGIYGTVNNWFVQRRALAISIVTLAQMARRHCHESRPTRPPAGCFDALMSGAGPDGSPIPSDHALPHQ